MRKIENLNQFFFPLVGVLLFALINLSSAFAYEVPMCAPSSIQHLFSAMNDEGKKSDLVVTLESESVGCGPFTERVEPAMLKSITISHNSKNFVLPANCVEDVTMVVTKIVAEFGEDDSFYVFLRYIGQGEETKQSIRRIYYFNNKFSCSSG